MALAQSLPSTNKWSSNSEDRKGHCFTPNPLFQQNSLFQLKGYFEHVKSGVYFNIPHDARKSSFITTILAVICKIAPHKKSFLVLEIGSTNGEFFYS